MVKGRDCGKDSGFYEKLERPRNHCIVQYGFFGDFLAFTLLLLLKFQRSLQIHGTCYSK